MADSLRLYRALAYAFFIIVGYIAITPEGPVPISTRVIIGGVGIVISIAMLAVDVLGVGRKSGIT